MPLLSYLLLLPQLALAVVNGLPADDVRFNAVGALKIGDEQKVACTATLISPKWIVTADHCIHASEDNGEEGGGDLLPASAYEFRLGNRFNRPVFRSPIKRWVGGPQMKGLPLDVAFGELELPVSVQQLQIEPIAPINQHWDAEDLRGRYVMIGYGNAKPFRDENSPLRFRRQQASFKVTRASENAMIGFFGSVRNLERFLMKFHPEALETTPLDGIIANGKLLAQYQVHAWDARGRESPESYRAPEGGWQDSCFGDSGGPLLREINGKLYIVGVVSQGMDRVCGTIGTRFTVFGPMIWDLMQELGRQ